MYVTLEGVKTKRKPKIKKTYRFSDETLSKIQAIKNYLEKRDNVMYYNTTVLEYLVSSKYNEIMNK